MGDADDAVVELEFPLLVRRSPHDDALDLCAVFFLTEQSADADELVGHVDAEVVALIRAHVLRVRIVGRGEAGEEEVHDVFAVVLIDAFEQALVVFEHSLRRRHVLFVFFLFGGDFVSLSRRCFRSGLVGDRCALLDLRLCLGGFVLLGTGFLSLFLFFTRASVIHQALGEQVVFDDVEPDRVLGGLVFRPGGLVPFDFDLAA